MGRNVRAEESRAEMVLGRGVPEPIRPPIISRDNFSCSPVLDFDEPTRSNILASVCLVVMILNN